MATLLLSIRTRLAQAILFEHVLRGQKVHFRVAIMGVAFRVENTVHILLQNHLHVSGRLFRAAEVEASQAAVGDVAVDVVRTKRYVAALASGAGPVIRPVTDPTNERLLVDHVAGVRVA